MTPSDGESDSIPDEIPAKVSKAAGSLVNKEDGEDESSDDDEYEMEKIVGHEFDKKNKLFYRVKWLGYDDEDDMTWEPLENLQNAEEKVLEYKARIGGTPEPETGSRKGSKKSSAKKTTGKRNVSDAFDAPMATEKSKKGRGSAKAGNNSVTKTGFEYPDGSWESLIESVECVVEDQPFDSGEETQSAAPTRINVLLQWRDGHKSQHPLSAVRTKCPQKLLDYYERHLVFTSENVDGNRP